MTDRQQIYGYVGADAPGRGQEEENPPVTGN